MPRRNDIAKILVIGSGPIVIGQSAEFDYSGTQACKALKAEGYEVVLVNSNPASIMTDPEVADRTYIEPLNAAYLEEILRVQKSRSARATFRCWARHPLKNAIARYHATRLAVAAEGNFHLANLVIGELNASPSLRRYKP